MQEGDATRAHERQLAHDARLWEDRRRAYVDLLNHLLALTETVEDTLPILRLVPVGGPAAAEADEQGQKAPDIDSEEQRRRLRELEVGVEAFGSRELVELTDDFRQKARMFSLGVGTYGKVREQAGPGQETAHEQLHKTRQELRDLYRKIGERIRTELTQAAPGPEAQRPPRLRRRD